MAYGETGVKEYKELAKLFHMDNSRLRDANARKEYETRFNAESTFHTGFTTPSGELFIAVPRELSTLSEHVLYAERKVSDLLSRLPQIPSLVTGTTKTPSGVR